MGDDEKILRAHTMQRAAAQSTGVNLGSVQGGSAFTDQVTFFFSKFKSKKNEFIISIYFYFYLFSDLGKIWQSST